MTALLVRSFQLAVSVTGLALLLGVPLAWLVARTDLPGRRWLTWGAALPLLFPPYIGAIAYLSLFGHAFYSMTGAVVVLALCTYPYIYLSVGSALRRGSQALEEVARSAGLGSAQVLWRVTLPLIRPALASGALLVGLYALSDFGAVAMLRVDTLTSAIYWQLRGRLDRSALAILSLVLVLILLLILWAEERIRCQGVRYCQTPAPGRSARIISLGSWRWPAAFFAWGIITAAVGMPTGALIYGSLRAVQSGVLTSTLLGSPCNSLLSGGGTALAAVLLGFPLAYLAARRPGPVSRLLVRTASSGFALPDLLVALAVLLFFRTFLHSLYGTAWALAAAYFIRSLPRSLAVTRSGLESVSPRLEEAGRSLGLTRLQVFRRITLPLTTPSLITGAALVFVNTLRELPASLLLRPAGFDTLAVRVWIEAEEGFFVQAAPAALLLVLLPALPTALLLRRFLAEEARLS